MRGTPFIRMNTGVFLIGCCLLRGEYKKRNGPGQGENKGKDREIGFLLKGTRQLYNFDLDNHININTIVEL
jgi:hypothetical protein